MFQGYPWLVFKVGILEKVLSDKDYFNIDDDFEHEDKLIKEMVKLEIVVTTVHFAEIFAANLLALSRYEKTYHKKLLEYNTGEIKDFYEGINAKSNSYIVKLMCYPDLNQIYDGVMLNDVVESCKLVKSFLIEIGKYYLDNLQIYNSYKHGFRIGIAEGSNEDGTNPRMQLIYPTSKDNLAEVTIKLGLDINKESSYCYRMYDILSNVVNTFSQRFLDEKSEFSMRVWHLKESFNEGLKKPLS